MSDPAAGVREAFIAEAAQVLVNMLRDRPATNLTARQWAAVEDLRAALATTGDSEGPLDVDIMGQAIHRVFNHGFHGGGRDAADGDIARSLFAEYARLSSKEPDR